MHTPILILKLDEWIVTKDLTSGQVRQVARHSSGRQYERILTRHEPAIEALTWLQLVQQADESLQPLEYESFRRAVRVLAMLSELHKMGFQRLRFHTQDKGIGLRIYINSADQFEREHGAKMINNMGSALYGSGMKNRYFGWTDATTDTARQLAAKFMVRFPELTEQGRGGDWAYAGWLQQVLGLAERGYFPLVSVDWSTDTPDGYIQMVGPTEGVTVPNPPGGEARGVDL